MSQIIKTFRTATETLTSGQVGYQAKELRRLGRVTAQQCADLLLLLREEARQHKVDAAPVTIAEWVDEDQLRQQLSADLPVSNLLEWLQHHYPSLPDQVLLQLYHDLAREDQWDLELETEPTTSNLSRVSVHYWPYRLDQSQPQADNTFNATDEQTP